MRARRLLDSCVLASTVNARPPISLVNALCHPTWIAPTPIARLAALLGLPRSEDLYSPPFAR